MSTGTTPAADGPQRLVIRVDGLELVMDDLTIAETARIEQAAGVNWHSLRPLSSMRQAGPLLAEVKARALNGDRAAARRWADGLTLRQMTEYLFIEPGGDDRPDEYVDGIPVVDPPQGAGE